MHGGQYRGLPKGEKTSAHLRLNGPEIGGLGFELDRDVEHVEDLLGGGELPAMLR